MDLADPYPSSHHTIDIDLDHLSTKLDDLDPVSTTDVPVVTLSNKTQGLAILTYQKYHTLSQGGSFSSTSTSTSLSSSSSDSVYLCLQQIEENNIKWQAKVRATYVRPHSLCLTTIVEEDNDKRTLPAFITKLGLRRRYILDTTNIPRFHRLQRLRKQIIKKKKPVQHTRPRRGYPPPSFRSTSWGARGLVKLIIKWNRLRAEELYVRARESRVWIVKKVGQPMTLAERDACLWNVKETARMKELWAEICGQIDMLVDDEEELENIDYFRFAEMSRALREVS
ncbi:hypothetical protein M422DRAFT_780931 [Sphaerobolus stellatus SS14]|uniref:Uncharacterized protein n=1 Tax=Sphaerobolus stellatus (strain SS14) TaxID=990650 RepID=A0A0C9VP95_SPHS4|nr:hypothetical protein M422DRAFT_780931 [Sphaerobolus stellatus SS14]